MGRACGSYHSLPYSMYFREPYKKSSMTVTSPSLNFLFIYINTCPPWHTGQSVHVACYVYMHWVVTAFFFLNASFLVMKYLVDSVFQSTTGTF